MNKYITLALCLISLVIATSATARADAVTTQNPMLPMEELDLLLLPLTRDQLAVETAAWRDLLREKLQAISEREIASRKMNDKMDKVDNGKGEQSAEEQQASDRALQQIEEEKKEVHQSLGKLREQKTMLHNRFVAVVDAYAKKGGKDEDVTEYRQYAKAVTDLTVEVTDTAAILSAINSWLVSEEGGIKWGLQLLKFFAILYGFWMVALFFAKLTRHATNKSQTMSELLKNFLGKFVKRGVLFIGVLVALSTIGVNVSALAALIGGGAFIIGFALQETLGNFAAGIMLLFYRPFDVGDVVEVGGVSGSVDNVSLVNTTIRSFDNKVILVPNKQVWGEVITNATASHQRRVDMVFGISYEDDIDAAKAIICEILEKHELVLKDPAPVVELNTLGESSVDFICRPWARTSDYWRVYWDVTKQIKQAFDGAGISIPFPQRDVHLYQSAPQLADSNIAKRNRPVIGSPEEKTPDKLKDFPDDTEESGIEDAQPAS